MIYKVDLISEFNKVTRYKIKIEKSAICLYTSNEHLGAKIKNTISFIISRKNKYTGINLQIYVQDTCWKLYNSDEGIQRSKNNGERHTLFMNWLTQLGKDVNSLYNDIYA